MDACPAPVVIGGIGGSGTRLIARCLEESGLYIGSDLNEAKDNLWFTLLFKRPDIVNVSDKEFDRLVEILLNAMTASALWTAEQRELIESLASKNREQHPACWLRKRADSLLRRGPDAHTTQPWALKEPNAHIVIDRLEQRLPHMKYIHVARNGLDMAHSRNQNQLRLWGHLFLDTPFEINPRSALHYWCSVHKRVLRIGAAMGEDFLFLNYDRLCISPEDGIGTLARFIGIEPGRLLDRVRPLIKVPRSIGRYKKYGADRFDREDAAYVAELGFDIS